MYTRSDSQILVKASNSRSHELGAIGILLREATSFELTYTEAIVFVSLRALNLFSALVVIIW
jgi:hypothetical protein